MPPISVMIVDESAPMRQMLTHMLSGDLSIMVVATAEEAQDIETKIATLQPKVLVMDSAMAKTSSLGLIDKICAGHAVPIIALVPPGPQGAPIARRALEAGAFDCLERPEAVADIRDLLAIEQRLRAMVRAAAGSKPPIK